MCRLQKTFSSTEFHIDIILESCGVKCLINLETVASRQCHSTKVTRISDAGRAGSLALFASLASWFTRLDAQGLRLGSCLSVIDRVRLGSTLSVRQFCRLGNTLLRHEKSGNRFQSSGFEQDFTIENGISLTSF